MNFLVTGVAGLLGSHLARSLIEEGNYVIGVDNLIGGYQDNIPAGCEFHKLDLMEFSRLDSLFTRDIDVVVHAACTAHEGLSVFSPALISRNTSQITLNILSKSIQRGVKRFVFMSSMARYGVGRPPFREFHFPEPVDPYGIAKVAAESAIRNLCQTHGTEFVILVPHNIIGPGQRYDDPFRNVASIMTNRMLQGLQPIIYGDGKQRRCFSFISDVVNPLKKAAVASEVAGKTINIGPDEETININELAQILGEIIGFKVDPIYVPDRPREVNVATCSSDLARELLNYRTEVNLTDGLSELVNYIRDRGPLPFDYSLDIEIINELTPQTWVKKLI